MAKFCQHCYDLPGELSGKPTGSVKEVGGVPSYVTQPGSGKGTIILATDIFGLGISNPKIVADVLSSDSGFTVVVPDYFEGEPMKPEEFVLPSHSSEGPPSDDQMGKNMQNMTNWVQKGHSPNETFPLTKKVIDAVKSEGPVGIVGFCYGGKIAALAAEEPVVSGAVIYHPAMLEADEAQQVKVPVLLNMADFDPTFNGVEDAWQKTLQEKKLLDSRSKKYSGSVHGFGSRPDQSKPDVMSAHKQALSSTADFFKQVLA